MMKIQLEYANAVAVIPAAALDVMGRADAADLKVLLALCADVSLRENVQARMDELCARVGCTADRVQMAISFWRGAGILTLSESAEQSAPAAVTAAPEVSIDLPATPAPKPRRADSLPQYTTEELTALLEKRHEAAALIDECQRIFGKIFNTHEVNVLVGLLDYLSLDAEYLVLLCAHCADLGKKSLHYMEKVAFDMVDGGVSDVAALQETLRREDAMREAEGKIRTLFGAGGRKLTQAERKYIHHWVEEWKFDMVMIERAYEATVDSIGEASMRYTDGVLKRWYTEGLMTPEAVEASDEKWRQEHEAVGASGNKPGKKGKKDGGGDSGGSFDTDDFFEAALRRSYQDM